MTHRYCRAVLTSRLPRAPASLTVTYRKLSYTFDDISSFARVIPLTLRNPSSSLAVGRRPLTMAQLLLATPKVVAPRTACSKHALANRTVFAGHERSLERR